MSDPPIPPIDFSSIANGATETDPITPNVEVPADSPFSEEEAKERDNFVLRALEGGRRDKPKRERKPRADKPVPPKPRPGSLVKPLTDLYVTVGTMLMPFDQPCAMAVINSAPKCAESLENLARENPAVRRALLALVETSVWGQVVAAHSPIILAIVIHHVPAARNSLAGVAGNLMSQGADDFVQNESGEAKA